MDGSEFVWEAVIVPSFSVMVSPGGVKLGSVPLKTVDKVTIEPKRAVASLRWHPGSVDVLHRFEEVG